MNKDKHFQISLAKVMLAAAWVDGELHPKELDLVNEFTKRIPELSDHERLSIELYKEYPMSQNESRHVVEDLVSLIRTEEEKEKALLHLDHVINADDVVTKEESLFCKVMHDYIHDFPLNFMEHFSHAFANNNKWTNSCLSDGEDRETAWLGHYINNPLYFRFTTTHANKHQVKPLLSMQLNQSCLRTSLYTCIALINGEIRPEQKKRIIEMIDKELAPLKDIGNHLVDLAIKEFDSHFNIRTQSLRFATITDNKEMKKFFLSMIDVFKHSKPSQKQLDKIREISQILRIDKEETEKAIQYLKN